MWQIALSDYRFLYQFLNCLPALKQQIALEEIDPSDKTIVVVLTGHGLKDPRIAVERASQPKRLPADIDALEDFIAGDMPGISQ